MTLGLIEPDAGKITVLGETIRAGRATAWASCPRSAGFIGA